MNGYLRRLRAILHRAGHEGLAAQNREERPNFEARLRGMVAYVTMVNPAQDRPLREALERLGPKGKPTVSRYVDGKTQRRRAGDGVDIGMFDNPILTAVGVHASACRIGRMHGSHAKP